MPEPKDMRYPIRITRKYIRRAQIVTAIQKYTVRKEIVEKAHREQKETLEHLGIQKRLLEQEKYQTLGQAQQLERILSEENITLRKTLQLVTILCLIYKKLNDHWQHKKEIDEDIRLLEEYNIYSNWLR